MTCVILTRRSDTMSCLSWVASLFLVAPSVFVVLFVLYYLSHLLRGGTTSSRIHLALGSSYFYPSRLWSSLAVRNIFRGICFGR